MAVKTTVWSHSSPSTVTCIPGTKLTLPGLCKPLPSELSFQPLEFYSAVKEAEALSALEEDEFGSHREVFIVPPDNDSGDFTDEDSGRKTVAGMVPSCLTGCCMLQSCLRTQTHHEGEL